jgi:hypothetical protein
MMLRVKNAFLWDRIFSAGSPILISAGAPVERHEKNKCFYVKPEHFATVYIYKKRGSWRPFKFDGGIEFHDATYYGCRVAPDNVVGEMEMTDENHS